MVRERGDCFWQWGDPKLHTRTHNETLNDGSQIDVQVRLSSIGATQMFIGIYGLVERSSTKKALILAQAKP